ncbi:iron chaperone [Cellulomonas gilvus]|uniref:YdhG-like domain-containing protein n=1 Tax=Cellulomonas gilvus (strain ATCC 13127 / NRRL B-14078) TaxID=593907 RepID=F7ZZU5_CELGA|nr:DUF1801 domain-containing protein [Cellulomonas gilvus]AEI12588.1 Domain of unknown function DUF1801 [Cellulomonas gilvus ATCC 13127]
MPGELEAMLAGLEEPTRAAVVRVYDRARALVPDAVDGLGYGMPALVHRGRPLVAVRPAARHIGLYPFSPAAIDAVRPELVGFALSKGTVRFTPERPVPDDVLDRLLTVRRDEIECA